MVDMDEEDINKGHGCVDEGEDRSVIGEVAQVGGVRGPGMGLEGPCNLPIGEFDKDSS